MEKLARISEELGLAINATKTKIMIVDRANNNLPHTRQVAGFEVVNSFVYLGAMITNKGGCTEEIKRRIAIARTATTKLRYGKIYIYVKHIR